MVYLSVIKEVVAATLISIAAVSSGCVSISTSTDVHTLHWKLVPANAQANRYGVFEVASQEVSGNPPISVRLFGFPEKKVLQIEETEPNASWGEILRASDHNTEDPASAEATGSAGALSKRRIQRTLRGYLHSGEPVHCEFEQIAAKNHDVVLKAGLFTTRSDGGIAKRLVSGSRKDIGACIFPDNMLFKVYQTVQVEKRKSYH